MAGFLKWNAGRKFAAFVAGLVLVPIFPVGFASGVAAAAAAPQPTILAAHHKGGKLSPRLLALSHDPHATALSLPRSGAGRLVRHRDGRLVVQIRMSDLSAAA